MWRHSDQGLRGIDNYLGYQTSQFLWALLALQRP